MFSLVRFGMLLLAGLVSVTGLAQSKGIKIVGGTAPAGTERRIAIVIGNKDYEHVRVLKNPLNDAEDMTRVLQLLGFEVIVVPNGTYKQVVAGLNRFKAKLTASDVALIYYSGHGVSYNGRAYLLPVDAELTCLEQIEENGISLNRILGEIAARNVRNSFVFLDACRNLPDLKVCTGTQKDVLAQAGLAKPANNPEGSLIVYATQEGNTADDNVGGRNGLFTEALLTWLVQPNLGIRTILDRTALAVREKSGRRQSPARYDELLGDFVFVINKQETDPTAESEAARARREIAEGIQAYKSKDYATAFRLLSAHSQQLDPHAQDWLGYMYYTGFGTVRNQIEAVKWFGKAADRGNAQGQANLGVMYEKGEGGLLADKAEAVRWYHKAADQGYAGGQASLGFMYENGYGGLLLDKAEAVRWYRKAADQGNAQGQANLGFMYENGYGGLEVDKAEAVRWYRKAADQGNATGQANLGTMYDNGYGGLEVDKAEAVRWYRKAADQGNATGQANLGFMYENGYGGLSLDKAEAVRWYRKAADRGNAQGQANLGVMYEKGEGGLLADKAEAVRWYRKAADRGNAQGQANLGVMYENGYGGLLADKAEAVRWYRKAADQGNAQGQANLGTMYDNGYGGLEVDKAEAVRWYRKAADQGNATGRACLGFMYENGYGGLAADRSAAVRYYQLAARQGNDFAQKALQRLGKTW